MPATRTLRNIPELVGMLREQKAREKDYIVPAEKMTMLAGAGLPPAFNLEGRGVFQIQPQVHAQIYGKTDIPGKYYSRLLGGNEADQMLLAVNVNHWWPRLKKKRLVRCVDDSIRGVVSDRYRPISHLDLLTTAIQVVSGQDVVGEKEDGKKPVWARGARAFAWQLSPTNLDVEFVNPSTMVDINHLERGVVQAPEDFGGQREAADAPQDTGHNWLRGRGGKGGEGAPQSPWLFPSCRIRNSETGHGGLTVEAGVYEAICDNTAHIGVNLAQIHLGRELQEADFWTPETIRKMNQVIFAQVADIVRNVFDPTLLLENARRFKALEDVKVDDVKVAAEAVAALPGMTEDVRDEILACYNAMTPARGNLFDFQRAVTASAHAFRTERPAIAAGLEDLGGAIIMKGADALLVAARR